MIQIDCDQYRDIAILNKIMVIDMKEKVSAGPIEAKSEGRFVRIPALVVFMMMCLHSILLLVMFFTRKVCRDQFYNH